VRALVCHPQTPCIAVRNIEAQVERTPQGRLEIGYRIEGDLERVRIPSPRAAAPGERLWQHTCCELFVARHGARAYHEFNFSPSGAWAAYAFSAYRQGVAFEVDDPRISVRRAPGMLELHANLQQAGKLRLGLSVVIEDDSGKLSYWALSHPAGKPDFHHPEAFALEIE
jgi:hypothetical protein